MTLSEQAATEHEQQETERKHAEDERAARVERKLVAEVVKLTGREPDEVQHVKHQLRRVRVDDLWFDAADRNGLTDPIVWDLRFYGRSVSSLADVGKVLDERNNMAALHASYEAESA